MRVDDTQAEPAHIVSASLDSEYDLENFRLKTTLFSSVYKKVSEWSLPRSRQVNLFTLNEDEHDFLVNDRGGSPSPSSSETDANNFDDVVDEMV